MRRIYILLINCIFQLGIFYEFENKGVIGLEILWIGEILFIGVIGLEKLCGVIYG